MSEAHNDIVSWLHEQQKWLQVAAGKVLALGVVSDDDISELAALLKTDEGQRRDVKNDFSEFTGAEIEYEELRINSIGEIQGIDNLAPRTPLQFGNSNLTVVYGNNGSGKSGYTRILKKACGKTNAAVLKPNIFESSPAVQQCDIGYSVDGADRVDTWAANAAAINALKNVDIFDAHTGKVYIDNEADAAYIPETVALFEDLVTVCKRIKVLLESEKNALNTKLPRVPAEYTKTKYEIAITTRIKAGVDKVRLKQFFEYSEDDKKNKADIEERLKEDPVALAKKKKQQKQQIENLVDAVNQAVDKTGPDASENIFKLQEDAKSKRIISVEGAAASTDKAVLPGIGTETWIAMWQAAKLYSDATAYPENEFPNVDDESHCVLCHQVLDANAKLRMSDFEAFVNSTLETEAAKAEKDYKNIIDSLPAAPATKQLETSLQAAQLKEDEWLSVFQDIWKNIQNVSDSLKNKHDKVLAGYELPKDVLKPISEIIKSLDKQIEQHNADAEKFDGEQLAKDLNDLNAKQWASGYLESIVDEVDRLNQIKLYDEWIALTNHRAISIKAGVVSKNIITDAYVKRFNNELAALGAKNIRVELVKTRIADGKVKHKVQLHGVVLNIAKAPDVLSEGEHRIVSLAAFLADVTGKPQNAPFIFDDPISSLDQVFEEKTISRLIELSAVRQVIVFTHRLSFLGLLNDKANPDQVYIRKEPWGCGEQGQVSLFAKKPINSIKDLKNNRLQKAKKAFNESGYDEYYPLAKSICSDFRILIERIVEFELLADVIQRHRRDVHTKNKIGNLSKIRPEDCELIKKLMTDFSIFEHSQPLEAPVEVPNPDELEVSIDAILTWHEGFKGREL